MRYYSLLQYFLSIYTMSLTNFFIFFEIIIVTGEPVYQLSSEKRSSHYTSLPAVFNSLPTSTNWEVFEKQLCNQSTQYENFLLQRGNHHMQPLNQHFFLSAKMNGTQKEGTGKSMKNALYILWYAKGTSQVKVTSNSEKIKCIALANVELCWFEGIRQAG